MGARAGERMQEQVFKGDYHEKYMTVFKVMY